MSQKKAAAHKYSIYPSTATQGFTSENHGGMRHSRNASEQIPSSSGISLIVGLLSGGPPLQASGYPGVTD